MVYRHKSYADKLFIRINRAILCRQGPCPHSDDSSRDELIFRGSYDDNAIPAIQACSENWKITHYSDKEFLSVTGPNTCMLMD